MILAYWEFLVSSTHLLLLLLFVVAIIIIIIITMLSLKMILARAPEDGFDAYWGYFGRVMWLLVRMDWEAIKQDGEIGATRRACAVLVSKK